MDMGEVGEENLTPEIYIYDGLFSNNEAGSLQNLEFSPTYFKWVRPSCIEEIINDWSGKEYRDFFKNIFYKDKIVFFSEQFVKYVPNITTAKRKIIIVVEPEQLHPDNYKNIIEMQDHFDYILTYSKEMIKYNPKKFLYYPFGGTWIQEIFQGIHGKTKNISACFSKKRSMEGHFIRHSIVENYEITKYVEGYGELFNNPLPLREKILALKDFRFYISVENVKLNNFFTEKIMDCFLTGTVPIYWGTENIGNYFNEEGIVKFNTVEELKGIIPTLTEEKYESLHNAIIDNYERAKRYRIPEDYIYKMYPFLFE